MMSITTFFRPSVSESGADGLIIGRYSRSMAARVM